MKSKGDRLLLELKMFVVGALEANCFIVNCSKTFESIVIDPGFTQAGEAEIIFSYIESKKLSVKFVVDTHGHPDHTCGNGLVKEKFEVPICLHSKDAHMFGESGKPIAKYFGFSCVSPMADILFEEGDVIQFGDETLKVLHLPGHTSGSVGLLGENKIFTGDVLFAGSIGRTDFPGSSFSDMQNSLVRLINLSDSLVVYPGHGPKTTIALEKISNPFL